MSYLQFYHYPYEKSYSYLYPYLYHPGHRENASWERRFVDGLAEKKGGSVKKLWPMMATVTAEHPKIDVLCYLAGTTFKRIGGVKEFPNAWEALQPLNKEFWLVSELLGQNQYAVFLGLNFKPGDWQKLGFVHCHSEEGTARLANLQYTAK